MKQKTIELKDNDVIVVCGTAYTIIRCSVRGFYLLPEEKIGSVSELRIPQLAQPVYSENCSSELKAELERADSIQEMKDLDLFENAVQQVRKKMLSIINR